MTNRSNTITRKVSTDFGSMYIHIDLNEHGHPCGGSISDPGKEPESQISRLVATLSEGLNEALASGGFGDMIPVGSEFITSRPATHMERKLIEALRESTALLDDFADLYERNEGSDTGKRTREFLRRNRALLAEIEGGEDD